MTNTVLRSGWLILDKPVGMSSAHAVRLVKRVLGIKKIGHAGTLDPLASGILPMAIGEATKLMPFVVSDKKIYHFTVQWGQSTTTDDGEGDVVNESSVRPTREQIFAVIQNFTGIIEQVPPAFSAIKIGGERAYKKARAGESVTMPKRQVVIHDLQVDEVGVDHASFTVSCSKGTYIRSLARDMALSLGTFGHVVMLRRLAVGQFNLDKAWLLDDVTGETALLPMEAVLQSYPHTIITQPQHEDIGFGREIESDNTSYEEGDIVVLMFNQKLRALSRYQHGRYKPFRVFPV